MTPIDPQSNARAAEEPEELTSTSHSQNKWTPTPQAFEKLLAALDPDRDKAGKLYENVRLKLLRYFERNTVVDADRYVDVTLDRVMRRLDEGETIVNLMAYVYTVASYVRMEAWTAQEQLRKAANELPTTIDAPQEKDAGESPRQVCFDKCLNELPVETRILILDYYSEERSAKIKLRRQMAKGLGIEMNALRIRAHRIRMSLETCVRECVARFAWHEMKRGSTHFY